MNRDEFKYYFNSGDDMVESNPTKPHRTDIDSDNTVDEDESEEDDDIDELDETEYDGEDKD